MKTLEERYEGTERDYDVFREATIDYLSALLPEDAFAFDIDALFEQVDVFLEEAVEHLVRGVEVDG